MKKGKKEWGLIKPDSTIGVFGHYGNKNLGDEAIITAAIQSIKQRIPRAKIIGFSIKPEDTAKRYQIPAYPIRKLSSGSEVRSEANFPDDGSPELNCHNKVTSRLISIKQYMLKQPLLSFLLKAILHIYEEYENLINEVRFLHQSFHMLRSLDILMVTGSNQFLDNFGGPWGFPYTLLKWSVLAKLAGVKLYFVSVGAGPINSKASKVLIRMALAFSDYTSFRDVGSKQLIEQSGFKGKAKVFPDLAHSLRNHLITTQKFAKKPRLDNNLVVGINPMPMYDARYWCVVNEKMYNDYVHKLSEFAATLQREGYQVFFWGTQKRDEDVIDDVVLSLEKDFGQLDWPRKNILYSRSVAELMDNISVCDITVATRFHGTVLSLLADKALLAICYYRKARELMEEMGQGEYAVPFDTFTVAQLLSKFRSLEKNRLAEIEKIKHKNEEYREALKQQYDRLFGPIAQ